MKNIHQIIDAGHGFNTKGKESEGFKNSNGTIQLKENNVNEAIANKLSMLHFMNDTPFTFITNEWNDISLKERCLREQNVVDDIIDDSMFISIHADAFHVKNVATGGTFFYHSEEGKKIAEFYTKYFNNNSYDLKIREPKQANFYMLKNTSSPAILFELGYMTSQSDLEYLKSESFRNKTAKLLYDCHIAYSNYTY